MKWLGPVFVAVILPLLLSEFTDWCPWFAKRLVGRAVHRLPEDSQARWEEEWLGDLASFEGRRLSILVRGLWIYFRAPRWGRMLQGTPSISQVLLGRPKSLVGRLRRQSGPALSEEERRAAIHELAQAFRGEGYRVTELRRKAVISYEEKGQRRDLVVPWDTTTAQGVRLLYRHRRDRNKGGG